MAPLVSVIIKSYNHATFVGQTIQSIVDQSLEDIEILITDDGSTDRTPEVIASFTDSRIRFERFLENRGISTAMNSLIARARGEYVAILNSDDFALPGRLEEQATFLKAHAEVGAVFSLARTVDENGDATQTYYDFTIPFSLPSFAKESWLRFFFFSCNCLCAPTAMVRRAAYEHAGPYDPRLTNLQDFDMWIRVATRYDLHVLREELTAFRVHSNCANASAPRRDTMLRSQFEFSRILQRFRKLNRQQLLNVFAADLAAQQITSDRSNDLLLAELALTMQFSPAHRLFALETLFEAAEDEGDYRRLRELTAAINLFGIPEA